MKIKILRIVKCDFSSDIHMVEYLEFLSFSFLIAHSTVTYLSYNFVKAINHLGF